MLINGSLVSECEQGNKSVVKGDIAKQAISLIVDRRPSRGESPLARLDTPAWLELNEAPGGKFQGKIAHIAGAIDPATRTLLTEVQVPNAGGRLQNRPSRRFTILA